MRAPDELSTPRLQLRHFRDEDLDAWARITGDAETMRFLGNGRAQSRADARASLGYMRAHWALRGFGLWAAEERDSGRLVGRVGLYQPEGWPGLEVGWLVERARWGEGMATEAGSAVLDWVFDAGRGERLISAIQPANRASIRVAEKLGERFHESRRLLGRRVSIYAIDRETWQSSRSPRPRQEAS